MLDLQGKYERILPTGHLILCAVDIVPQLIRMCISREKQDIFVQ